MSVDDHAEITTESAWTTAKSAGIFPSDDETERRLNSRIKLLGISPKTRKFYQTYRWQGRYRAIRHWLYIVAILNLACAGIDCFIIGETTLTMMTVVARFVISGAFVTGATMLYRLRRHDIEGLSVIAPCTILLLATGIVGLHGPPALLERYAVNAWFVVGTGVVFLRLDFLYTCLLTIIALTVLPIFIIASGIKPDMAKAEIVLFHVGAMTALWNAQRIQMMHRYRGILLSLKNKMQARKLGELATQLRDMATTDQLTGIANRRCFNETCAELDDTRVIGVMMLDIDHFKALNDTLGHVRGDDALKLVASAIKGSIRDDDFVARYGGEEFVVLLRDVTLAEAQGLAERVRKAVAALSGPGGFPLTISAGVATGCGAQQAVVLNRADAALYQAKKLGRNRVVSGGDPTELETPMAEAESVWHDDGAMAL